VAPNVVIFGATSAIAHALARLYAARSASFVLVARDRAKLDANAADLSARGASRVASIAADLTDLAPHRALVERALAELPRFDVVLIAHGVLPDQRQCEIDLDALRQTLETNFTSAASLAAASFLELERQKSGTLVVLASVAGDRGRRSNYAYGAAKAGIAAFLEGLALRGRACGVGVLTVKPGLVDTPMTARFRKGLLWTSPEHVAGAVMRAIDRGRTVIYVPWFWRPIMGVIRALPRPILARLPF
jgi:short-subunit dehydrogenase